MGPLSDVSSAIARRLEGLVFDLDDTVLDHGALGEATYASLFRLRESGLRLIACTGRPAGWGEFVMRQWPIDAAVTENGAIGFSRQKNGRVMVLDRLSDEERVQRRRGLWEVAEELCRAYPQAGLADDNSMRRSDVTVDIGEHRTVERSIVDAMTVQVHAQGLRTFRSSVHLHLTEDPDDKASGAIGVLVKVFGVDSTAARSRYAYVGDSENDARAFAAFSQSFGVANVRKYVPYLSVPPRYVATEGMGAGFTQIAARLLELRG